MVALVFKQRISFWGGDRLDVKLSRLPTRSTSIDPSTGYWLRGVRSSMRYPRRNINDLVFRARTETNTIPQPSPLFSPVSSSSPRFTEATKCYGKPVAKPLDRTRARTVEPTGADFHIAAIGLDLQDILDTNDERP